MRCGYLPSWLQAYRESVLGALLLFGGLELAIVCRDQTQRDNFFVMVLTTGVCKVVNSALGFVVECMMMPMPAGTNGDREQFQP